MSKTYRGHTTINGQELWSQRYDRKSDRTLWLARMTDIRKKLKEAKPLEADERTLLGNSGFNFEVYEGDIVVNELAAKFLKYRAKNFVPGTAQPNLGHLKKYFLPKFGTRNAYSIKTPEIRRFLQEIKMKKATGRDENKRLLYKESEQLLAKTTLDRIKVTISLLFQYGIEEGILGDSFTNPVPVREKRRGSRKAKADEKIKFWLEETTITSFLKQAYKDDPRLFALATFCLNTGARKAEALALTYSDLDKQAGYVVISKILEQSTFTIVPRTKSGESKERAVPVPEPVYQAIEYWKAHSKHTKQSDFIFSRDDGRPYGPRQLIDDFGDICTKAQVDNIDIHGLRHTYGTHYIMKGGKVEKLQKLMGHEHITTTMKYVHIVEKFSRAKEHVVSFSFEVQPDA
jgi:integrase